MIEVDTSRCRSSLDDAVAAVGGWTWTGGSPEEHVPALIARQPKALRYNHRASIAFLREIPDLEFLQLSYPPDDVEVINDLTQLRGLILGEGWHGELRLDRFPGLEWFAFHEIRRQTSPETILNGCHQLLRHLNFVKLPHSDLGPLAETFPNLTHLGLGRCAKLESLRGIDDLTALRSVDLYHLPKLASLDGIDQAGGLDAITLTTLSKITDIAPVAALRGVRFLRIDLKTVDSLKPLADHPTIQALQVFSKVTDGDPSPLLAMPALQAFDGSLERALGEDRPPNLYEVPGLQDTYIRALNG